MKNSLALLVIVLGCVLMHLGCNNEQEQVKNAVAAEKPTPIPDPEPVEDFFRIYGDPRMRTGHSWIRRTPEADTMGRLSEIADEHAKGPVSTFYISANQTDHADMENIAGYDPKENYDYIYAYWKENNSILVLYPPYNVEDVTYLSWAYSTRRIDLSKNVKKAGDPTFGENSVTPEEAKRLLSLCVDHGVKIIIDKSHRKTRESG